MVFTWKDEIFMGELLVSGRVDFLVTVSGLISSSCMYVLFFFSFSGEFRGRKPRRRGDAVYIPGPSPANIWVFPKIGVPQNGWFIMENPIKMDDLGVPLFSETPIWKNLSWFKSPLKDYIIALQPACHFDCLFFCIFLIHTNSGRNPSTIFQTLQ